MDEMLGNIRTLAEVAAKWAIADVVVQDEYSHDVLGRSRTSCSTRDSRAAGIRRRRC